MPKITLKAARVNKGLTQKEAANKLGVGIKTLWNWENYITTPDLKYVEPICDLYGMTYDTLIFLPTNNA